MAINKTNKKLMLGIFGIIAIALVLNSASAEFWACFSKGDKIDFCNPKTEDRTAPNNGYTLCMSSYNETKGCYNQGSWPKCNTLPGECSYANGSSGVDSEPPILTINAPEQNGIYTSRSVLLSLKLDEKADVYYIDNFDNRGRWTRVCSDCYSYNRTRSFQEGLNDLTFKAVDVVGNTAYYNLSFFIDSKEPKIRKTMPKKDFASGLFEVEFSEENPESLILYYENLLNQENQSLDIEKDCISENGKYYCAVDADLANYDNQIINYWFELIDIAGNKDESKKIALTVDTTAPINSLQFNVSGRKVNFIINVTEKNFEEVSYYDNSERNPRWRKLCSRLKDGICEARKTFSIGYHVLDIRVLDKAGNFISERIEFDIV